MATIEAGLSTRKAGFADRTERGMGERLRGADPDVSTLGEGKLVRPNIGYLNCRCCCGSTDLANTQNLLYRWPS